MTKTSSTPIWGGARVVEAMTDTRGDPTTGAAVSLSIGELSSGYGRVKILNDVSFDVRQGEIVGILGRNGAGKTTLLKSIMGIVRPWEGHVTLRGQQSLQGLSPNAIACAGVGYVPQGRGIFPALTVLENLKVTQFAHGKPTDRVDSMVELFPVLKSHLNSRGGGLSGGQQQILALARALVGEPQVLLLDEPSEGIQPSILDSIIEILQRLMSTSSVSILLVEQNLDFAAELVNRAYLMDMGKIVQSLEKSELDANRLARNLMLAS